MTRYSPYHFGRLFGYIADMPLSDYIRRRKLSLAAMALQSGKAKVIELAVLYGYDSADSFARAFVKQHGVTPSAARRPGVSLKLFPPLTFQIKIKGVQAMNWRIEEKEAFEVFGIERIFGNDESELVPGFWTEIQQNGEQKRLCDATGEAMPERGDMVLRAACGYCEPGEDVFPYMVCAVKTPKSKTVGFRVAQIPAATWAVFRSEPLPHIGTAIPDLFSRAYSEWLPSSGYDKALGPDLEIYGLNGDGTFYEEV